MTSYNTIRCFQNPEEERLENIEGNGENAGRQRFLFFPCFSKVYFSGSLKLGTDEDRVRLSSPSYSKTNYCKKCQRARSISHQLACNYG